jgi:hypothetical protein
MRGHLPPGKDADRFYAVVLLRKSSHRRYDRRAAWKRDELAPLHFAARIGNGCSLAQFGAEIARLAFNWDVPDVRSGSPKGNAN